MKVHPTQRIQETLRKMAAAHAAAMAASEEVMALLAAEFEAAAVSSTRTATPQATASDWPVIDRPMLSVAYRGRSCFLGNTLPFRLLERLLRRPNQYVSHEQLQDDVWNGEPSPESIRSVVKELRRKLRCAGSRELSSKVFKGQCRLIELGYRQGGAPGFGLRRMLINQAGESKGLLSRGECKSLQTDCVVLVFGPDNEVQHVRRIYEMFTQQGKQESEIAAILNADGVVTDLGRPWNRGTVRQVLTNEKYIGNSVYNRTSFKLKKKHVCNPPEIWVRKDNAFPALVSPELFFVARGVIQERNRRLSNEEMLARLRKLAEQHPTLSGHLIDATEGMPLSAAYRTAASPRRSANLV